MNPYPMPGIRFLKESQLGEDSLHSLLISLLRGLAAIEVAAAHLRAGFFPGLRTLDNPALWYQGLSFLTGFAHQAVVVFFLISGWLVGGSLLNKLGQPRAIKSYAIDRVTRLWTVLLPTFVLILASGIVTGVIDPHAPDFSRVNDYSVTALLGNLFGPTFRGSTITRSPPSSAICSGCKPSSCRNSAGTSRFGACPTKRGTTLCFPCWSCA
jgi:peptidoglycan/LPS O-acetylase OafA/YrhL